MSVLAVAKKRIRRLERAMRACLKDAYRIHDTEPNDLKYCAPYGGLVKFIKALEP